MFISFHRVIIVKVFYCTTNLSCFYLRYVVGCLQNVGFDFTSVDPITVYTSTDATMPTTKKAEIFGGYYNQESLKSSGLVRSESGSGLNGRSLNNLITRARMPMICHNFYCSIIILELTLVHFMLF